MLPSGRVARRRLPAPAATARGWRAPDRSARRAGRSRHPGEGRAIQGEAAGEAQRAGRLLRPGPPGWRSPGSGLAPVWPLRQPIRPSSTTTRSTAMPSRRPLPSAVPAGGAAGGAGAGAASGGVKFQFGRPSASVSSRRSGACSTSRRNLDLRDSSGSRASSTSARSDRQHLRPAAARGIGQGDVLQGQGRHQGELHPDRAVRGSAPGRSSPRPPPGCAASGSSASKVARNTASRRRRQQHQRGKSINTQGQRRPVGRGVASSIGVSRGARAFRAPRPAAPWPVVVARAP